MLALILLPEDLTHADTDAVVYRVGLSMKEAYDIQEQWDAYCGAYRVYVQNHITLSDAYALAMEQEPVRPTSYHLDDWAGWNILYDEYNQRRKDWVSAKLAALNVYEPLFPFNDVSKEHQGRMKGLLMYIKPYVVQQEG